VRNYGYLYTDPTPTSHEDKDFLEFYNEDSLVVNDKAMMEPALVAAKEGAKFQFMRKGYYTVDRDATSDKQVFNLTVSLKDSYNKKKK